MGHNGKDSDKENTKCIAVKVSHYGCHYKFLTNRPEIELDTP
jgi:hypothetical protein